MWRVFFFERGKLALQNNSDVYPENLSSHQEIELSCFYFHCEFFYITYRRGAVNSSEEAVCQEKKSYFEEVSQALIDVSSWGHM